MKRLILILSLLFPAMGLGAQTLRVDAPNLVAADEQFNVTFSVEGEHSVSSFEWNPGEGFKLVWGPQKSTYSSTSIVNGKRSKSVTNSYTYVLMPVHAGSFNLPAATATVQGKTLSSKPFTIEVVSGGGAKSQSGSTRQQGSASGSSAAQGSASISSDDIYMRLIVNKNRAYVGEGITATLKLYQRVNIAGFEDARFPSFNGFWSQELQAPSNIDFKRENVGGEIFNTAVIRSWNLIPQKPGDFTIDPAELVCLVNVRAASSSSGSIFDSFFQDSYRQVRKRVSTQPVVLHVSSLPAGAPASFGGGVGRFELKAALTRDSLKAHEAASLKVTVSGSGNLPLLTAPKISFPPDFEVYDVKSTDSGRSRVFEYPFIPRSHGDFEIGPVEYSYFDLSTGKYVTLSSGPLHLSVARGAGMESSSAAPGGQLVQTRRDVKDLGSDIRFISTKLPALSGEGRFFVFSTLFWVLAVLMILSAAVSWYLLRRSAARRADVAGSRNRAATKMARKRLALAGEFLHKNLSTAFYEELHKALLGFISDKFALDAGEQSHDIIASKLLEAGVPEALSSDFTGLLDACEYARYAPAADNTEMNSLYEKSVSAISAIDSSMKKNKSAAGAVLALLMLVLPFSAQAASSYPDSLWTVGVSAYADGNWEDAARAWSAIEALGLSSPELCCNLGDAYFRQERIGDAILYYSRALKLDPSYGDARFNLEFARSLTQDRIDSVPEFFLKGWMRKLCWCLPSDAWAWISVVLLAAVLALVLIFLLSRSSGARKWGFFGGAAALVLMVLALSFAAWQKRDFMRADDAVVTRPVVSVRSAPSGSDTKDLFILHEGTELELLDSVGDWSKVRLADGREGWLRTDQIKVI